MGHSCQHTELSESLKYSLRWVVSKENICLWIFSALIKPTYLFLMSVWAITASVCRAEQTWGCPGCLVRSEQAGSSGQDQADWSRLYRPGWLVLVNTDAALLRLEPASNKYVFSSGLGMANSPSCWGKGCRRAAEHWGRAVHKGGAAAKGQRCTCLPASPGCTCQKRGVTATGLGQGGRRSSHS